MTTLSEFDLSDFWQNLSAYSGLMMIVIIKVIFCAYYSSVMLASMYLCFHLFLIFINAVSVAQIVVVFSVIFTCIATAYQHAYLFIYALKSAKHDMTYITGSHWR